MMLFALLASALVALALVLVLPPLLNRQAPGAADAPRADQASLAILREHRAQLDAERAAGHLSPAQHGQALAELRRRALDEENTAATVRAGTASARSATALALAIPGLVLALYLHLGQPQALSQPLAAAPDGAVTAAQVEDMVARLAQRLHEAPDGEGADPQAWEMLARSYAALQRFAEASRAYERAERLAPANAQLLADHADVLAALQGQGAQGEPRRLVERALALDPDNLKALALAGSAAHDRGDLAAALRYWGRAQALAPAGSEFARDLAASLAEARQAMGAASPAVQGVVQLAPALVSKLGAQDTVFIVARAAQGPRMPLAVLRYRAAELPIRFSLDDSAAMTEELKLSRFPQVVLSARVSRSGQALPQSGDLVGQTGPVAAGGAAITLTIDNIQP